MVANTGIPEIDRYVEAVHTGRLEVCHWVKRAVARHIADLEHQTEYYFEPRAARHVFDFVETLHHHKGKWAGARITLEPWQKFIIGSLFGWLRRSDKMRRFKESYVEVPRKNGKTLISAALGLYGMIADSEPGAEVYSAATSRDQAKILWRDAKLMVESAPAAIRSEFKVTVGQNTISVPAMNALFQPLSKDHGRLDGLNVHFAMLDEMHAWPNRELYDVIVTATGSRTQPLVMAITTAGTVINGIAQELRTYLTKVLDGVITDERFFGIIFTIDEADEERWDQPDVWRKANPNFGISIHADQFEDFVNKARESVQSRYNFLTKHLNVWVTSFKAFMNMQRWEACRDTTMNDAELTGKTAYLAVDLSSRKDLSAVVAMYWHNDKLSFWARAYMPEDTLISKEARLRKQFMEWRDAGLLIVTPGEVNDYALIESDVAELCKKLNVINIGYDPWQSNQMAGNMAKLGLPIMEIRQTVQMLSEPMKTLESLTLSGQLRHNNPVLSWCVSNLTAKTDKKENIFPGKENASDRIDLGVAAIMCLALHVTKPLPKSKPKRQLRTWTV